MCSTCYPQTNDTRLPVTPMFAGCFHHLFVSGIMKASIGYVEQFHRGLVVADEFIHKTLVMPSKLIDFVGMGHLGCNDEWS